jgi:hypothetical protein
MEGWPDKPIVAIAPRPGGVSTQKWHKSLFAAALLGAIIRPIYGRMVR